MPLYVSWVIVLELQGLSPVPACSVGTKWGRLFCWQGVVDMFLLGGMFRCAVDGVIMFLMGRPVTSPMARLVTFSVDRLGCFLFLLGGTFRCVVDGVTMSFMGGPVTSHMARLATFSVGGLGVFLSVVAVKVKWCGGCLVGACIFSLPPLLGGHRWGKWGQWACAGPGGWRCVGGDGFEEPPVPDCDPS